MVYDSRPVRVLVRQRGQLTIPRNLRESLSIEDGDTLELVPVGDTLVIAPRPLQAPALADRLAGLMEEAGLSLADLLDELPRIREELYRERYEAGGEE